MTRKITMDARCEKCGKLAKHEVNEVKEGVSDRGWKTYEIVAEHLYCNTCLPQKQNTENTHN